MNFMAIPIFKHLLGDSIYGSFNLLFTSLVIANTALVGWITQSIVRLHHAEKNDREFVSSCLYTSAIVSLCAIPIAAIILGLAHISLPLIIVYCVTLFASSQQVTLVAVGQATFNAKLILFTEAVRTSIYFGLGFLFLYFFGQSYGVVLLLLALFISYTASATLLSRKLKLPRYLLKPPALHIIKKTGGQLFRYGFNLMLWIFFSYVILFADRYMISIYFNSKVSGNYAALYDLISRSIILLSAPFLTSSFPVMAREFELGKSKQVAALIRKLVLAEVAGMLLAIILYYAFGFNILKSLLKLKQVDINFRETGLLIMIGTFIFQIAMMLHKKLELLKRTRQMLFCIVFSVVISFSINILLLPKWGPLAAGFAFVVASSVYATLIILSKPRLFLKGEFLIENKANEKQIAVI